MKDFLFLLPPTTGPINGTASQTIQRERMHADSQQDCHLPAEKPERIIRPPVKALEYKYVVSEPDGSLGTIPPSGLGTPGAHEESKTD